MNYLEALAAEYYAYTGYFVRSNVRTRKRPRGGYDIEMDVLAFMPNTQKLVHVETSGMADTWKRQREKFIEKKFCVTREEYEEQLGCAVYTIQKVVILGWAKTEEPYFDGDIEILSIPAFVRRIKEALKDKHPLKEIVPEHYPLLRSMQMVLHYGK